MATRSHTPWTWSRESAIFGMAAALLFGGFSGYVVGQHTPTVLVAASPGSGTGGTAVTSTGSGTGSSSPSTSGGTTSTTVTAFTQGAPAPWHTKLLTPTGHPAYLARGTTATIVVEMATWCLFCGYTDKYDVPLWLKTPGVTVDIVDLSPETGIADPGPKSPAFSGHDGSPENAATTAQMGQTLLAYAKQYGTLGAAHLYVAPTAVQTTWESSGTFPTLVFIKGTTVQSITPGAYTTSQAQSALQTLLSS